MAKINITQVRSRIGSTKLQKKNLDALGLRKMSRTVQHNDSPVIMGMVEKVKHLVRIEMDAAPLAKKETKKTVETATPKAEKAVEVAPKAPAAKKPAAAKPAATKSAKPATAKAAPKAAKDKNVKE